MGNEPRGDRRPDSRASALLRLVAAYRDDEGLPAGRLKPSFWQWMSERTGVGTPQDHQQRGRDHPNQSQDAHGDFQDMVDVATAADPLFQFCQNITGGGWSQYNPQSK